MTLDALCVSRHSTDFRVLGEVGSALGLRLGVFVRTGNDGGCRMLGKATSPHLLT